MTRERWMMVLMVALVLACLALAVNTTPQAQIAASYGRYQLAAVAIGDAAFVFVLDTTSGQVQQYRYNK